MEHSSSGSTNSDHKQVNASAGENNDTRPADANDVNNQRMVADRLLAALASGNLEHLAKARQAFLKQVPGDKNKEVHPRSSNAPTPMKPIEPATKETPSDLEASLERRTAPRTAEHDFVAVDELRKEEEELRQAEAELERRRAEVAAAKKKAEDEAKRRAFEESRRQLEAETRKRAEEEQQRIATLQGLRDQAEAATRERAHKQREINASIEALKLAEQEELKQIADAEQRISRHEDECRRLHVDAQQRTERVQWLTEE